MTGLIALIALVMSIVALVIAKGIADNTNRLIVRIDALERKKGIKQGETWIVMLKPESGRGKPTAVELAANNEGDAVRQIILKKWMDRMVSLERKKTEE